MGGDVVVDLNRGLYLEMAKKGKRTCGRDPSERRKLRIEEDVIRTADGSAKVCLGETEVLVGVKAVVGETFPDTPDRGGIRVNCELIPMASPNFESGRPRERAIEIARVVDRGIRESDMVDLRELCVEEGGKAWNLFVDIHVLDYNGNIFDTAGIGAVCALKGTVIPFSREDGDRKDRRLELRKRPVPATFAKIDGLLMLDPDLGEEKVCETELVLWTDEDGAIRAVQKSGAGRLKPETIENAIDIALENDGDIRRMIFGK